MEFIRAHGGGNGNGGKTRADISIYGQESNYTTWRLAKMNLAIRGIDGQLREQQAEAAKPDAAITRNLKELGYG